MSNTKFKTELKNQPFSVSFIMKTQNQKYMWEKSIRSGQSYFPIQIVCHFSQWKLMEALIGHNT